MHALVSYNAMNFVIVARTVDRNLKDIIYFWGTVVHSCSWATMTVHVALCEVVQRRLFL